MRFLERFRKLEQRREEALAVVHRNRILVLGSRLSGAFTLADNFQEYLEKAGIPNPDVEVLRDAGMIKDAFLGRGYSEANKHLEDGTLPRGVILFPEMRQYTPSGSGMSLQTYECGIDEYVEGLCAEYGVPLAEIRPNDSLDQLNEEIKLISSEINKAE